jgi:hypothetical protein
MPDLQTLTVTGWAITILGFCVIAFAGYKVFQADKLIEKTEDEIINKGEI